MAVPTLLQFPQTLDARIRRAIHDKRRIDVTYNGRTRRAEPHDYGRINGVDRLFVFQLDKNAWRMFDVPKIEALVVLDGTFAGSRRQAHEHHHRWDEIYARVE
ncbi:MAG TPA: WYL domain-containing protein [Vicinamibacterales bacterium]|nr:WYL domain-containing protein [Vicinamibacterales bacterium]